MDKSKIASRIKFLNKLQIMEVDFSDIMFDTAQQVNEFYDVVDEKLEANGQKWYFLVNYRNCKLAQWAWLPFARRGKKVNLAHSLGTARFEVDEETGSTIREKSKQESFEANMFATRDNALAKIEDMKRGAA